MKSRKRRCKNARTATKAQRKPARLIQRLHSSLKLWSTRKAGEARPM